MANMLVMGHAITVAVLIFWLLDAKYLRLERLYRKLYDHIRMNNDFDAFSMKTSDFEKDVSSPLRIAFSWSVIWFYVSAAMALVAGSQLSYILK